MQNLPPPTFITVFIFFSVQPPNGNNVSQTDPTRDQINFNGSSSVVFSLDQFLRLQASVADFVADNVTVTEGQSVTFTDLSTHNPTAWQWTFEGGTPATSTENHSVVTYNDAGEYDLLSRFIKKCPVGNCSIKSYCTLAIPKPLL